VKVSPAPDGVEALRPADPAQAVLLSRCKTKQTSIPDLHGAAGIASIQHEQQLVRALKFA